MRRGWAKRMVIGLVWCTVLALAAGAALRIFCHDFWIPLVWWNAFTLYVYLPVYVCLLIALLLRRWRLAGLSAAVAACHLVWIAPDVLPRGRKVFDAQGDAGGTNHQAPGKFRLYYQNLNMHTDDYQQRMAEILAADPDVIALIELAPAWEDAIRKSPILSQYPHHTLRANPARSQQLAIFSKTPLVDVEHRFVLSRRLAVAETLHVGGTPVRMFCIHAPRPLEEQAEQYRGYWRDIIAWINAAQGARIVVGDFNATQHNAWYQRLTSRAHLHSAHRDAGRGYAVTWPNGRFPLPPIRIDHVLLSSQLACQSIREGSGGQSDHKPLICDLVLASGGAEEQDGDGGE